MIIAFPEYQCMWLFDFVLLLSYKQVIEVLVGIIHENLEKDMGYRIHINASLTRNLVWPMLIFQPH